MSDPVLEAIRQLIQHDVGGRGLATEPDDNLLTATTGDFEAACRSIAETPTAAVGIVTGFLIPHAEPPAPETDGPLGALFLARTLTPLGVRVVIAAEDFCRPALSAGLDACGLSNSVILVELPHGDGCPAEDEYRRRFIDQAGPLTHLIALERVGPSHTVASVQDQAGATPEDAERFVGEVPAEEHDRCHTMRGRDITAWMSPAHHLFEGSEQWRSGMTTIGIGDGGNEIGMGKVRWDVVRRNIARGGVVACRVAVKHLIVCGISNWGAYGLAAGVLHLRGVAPFVGLFDPDREEKLLREMVERGGLVDGVSGRASVSVDGLPFERSGELLQQIGALVGERGV